MSVPKIRIHGLNGGEWRAEGDYVLYWMVASRRSRWNYALQYAVERAREMAKPLVVLEAIRCDHRWSSERIHRFVMDGMADHGVAFAQTPALYYPYVERQKDEGKGLLEAMAQRACGVVTDLFPGFFLPRMLQGAAGRVKVALEAVDSNGLLPLRAAETVFSTAYAFRRFLHKTLPPFLLEMPEASPLSEVALPRLGRLPAEIVRRWPAVTAEELAQGASFSGIAVSRAVRPVVGVRGGEEAAQKRMRSFLAHGLGRYAEERNEPALDVTSGLSPYLHFGHLSAHEVFADLVEREGWEIARLGKATGQREGWWGMSKEAEAFLDELVTWREVGFNMAYLNDQYDQYASLPDWAKQTLDEHRHDPRPYLYSLAEFEQAKTHDPLWNAAQIQLVREGKIHNYLRMLWGKKILEWTRSPEDALAVMIELNNKYALDGRDPNSYSGIFWVLGRYDRAWGPERPIFGKIRYMSSDNTGRKVQVKEYIARYAP